MYFVVFLDVLRKQVIVPAYWINDIAEHFEKFVNKSLNTNQWFLCYYTNDNAAFINGQPNKDYEPDFGRQMVNDISGAFDGCFLCKLVHFGREYLINIL